MSNPRHRFKVRPAYHSTKLLIEFGHTGSSDVFCQDLKEVLKQGGATLVDAEDLIQLVILHYESKAGSFTIEVDDWDIYFAMARKNPKAIHFLEKLLDKSDRFEREEVDRSEYV